MDNNRGGKNTKNMQQKTPEGTNQAEDGAHVTNEDLEEFESVNNEIDSINAFLDSLESNVDNIKEQLVTIMSSNREILKELKEEKEGQDKSEGGGGHDERPMEN